MYEEIDMIVSFKIAEGDKNAKKDSPYRYNNTMSKVKPLRFKYKDKGINVEKILRTYEENRNGEIVLGYRCYYKERGFYYHLLFFTKQCKWFIKFENRN